jgi:hypothetical protein
MTDGLPNTPPSTLISLVREAHTMREVKVYPCLTGSTQSESASEEREFLQLVAQAGGQTVVTDMTERALRDISRCPLPYAAAGGIAALREARLKLQKERETRLQQRMPQADIGGAGEEGRRGDKAAAAAEVTDSALGDSVAGDSAATQSQQSREAQEAPQRLDLRNGTADEHDADEQRTGEPVVNRSSLAVDPTSVSMFVPAPIGFTLQMGAATQSADVEAALQPLCEALQPVDPLRGGYVLALPSHDGVAEDALGRYFPGVVAGLGDGGARGTCVCVRFFTGEYDNHVPVDATRDIGFNSFCEAVRLSVEAQGLYQHFLELKFSTACSHVASFYASCPLSSLHQENGWLVEGLWPALPEMRSAPPPLHRVEEDGESDSAEAWEESRTQRPRPQRLDPSEREQRRAKAEEEQQRRMHEMAVMAERAGREAREPERRLVQAARTASINAQRVRLFRLACVQSTVSVTLFNAASP